jgi:hypothetical protein
MKLIESFWVDFGKKRVQKELPNQKLRKKLLLEVPRKARKRK